MIIISRHILNGYFLCKILSFDSILTEVYSWWFILSLGEDILSSAYDEPMNWNKNHNFKYNVICVT